MLVPKCACFFATLARLLLYLVLGARIGFLRQYGARIFALASECHVQLQSYFISTAIAIKILEGMASSLDPEVDIANNALPYIVSARYRLGLQAKDVSVTRGG